MSIRLLFVIISFLFSAPLISGHSVVTKQQDDVTGDMISCEDLCATVDDHLRKCTKSQENKVFDYLMSIRHKNDDCWIPLYEKVISWYEQSEPHNDSLLCKLYTTLGARYKAVPELRDTALAKFQTALAHGKSVYPDSTLEIYKIYYNIADTYNYLLDNKLSVLYADTALYYMGYDNSVMRKERCYITYARAYSRLGDEFIFDGYDALCELYAKNPNGGDWSYYINDLIKSQKDLKNYQKALDITLEKLCPDGESINSLNLDNNIRFDLYGIYLNIGEYDRAEYQLLSMSKSEITDTLIHYNNMAGLYTEKKDYAGANIFYRECIDISKKENLHNELYYTYHNMIELFNNQSQYDSAYHYLQLHDALIVQHGDGPKLKLDNQMKRAKNELITLYEKSKQTDNTIEILKDAHDRFLRIDSIINNQINDYTDDQSLMSSLKIRRRLYDHYLPVCLSLHQLEPHNKTYAEQAVSIVEKNKSVILLSNVLKNRMQSDNRDIAEAELVKDSIIDNIKYLKDDKIDYNNRLSQSLVLCRQLRRLRTLYNSDDMPTYISDKVISNDVSYRDRNFLMYHNVIGNDSSYYRIYNVNEKLEFDIIQLSIADVELLKNNFSQDKMSELPKLNLQLLSDVVLPHDLPLDVMIMPDHHLSFLPFEILPYNGAYLIQHAHVSYAFSLSHQNAIENLPSTKTGKVVCFAPSYHISIDELSECQQTYKGTRRSGELLTELDYNVGEIESISKHFTEALLYRNDEATKEKFISDIEGASIIHIAAHATASTDVGDNYIYFCSQDSSADYALSLTELYGMNIPADLVTLSACETGVGKTLTSEGVLSISRGFAYAGSKSVVNSLWSVDDESTSIIMTDMYKYLDRGDRKDVALRKAKLDYINKASSVREKHPFYWAGFVAIGDMSPIVDDKFSTLWYLLVGLVFGFIILILLNRNMDNGRVP